MERGSAREVSDAFEQHSALAVEQLVTQVGQLSRALSHASNGKADGGRAPVSAGASGFRSFSPPQRADGDGEDAFGEA